MKKIFKIFIFTIFSFCFTLRVNAGVCSGNVITLEDLYHETGWDTYAFKCTYSVCDEDYYSGCVYSTKEEAQNSCELEYQHGYKGRYETIKTGKCNDSKVRGCVTGSATCTYYVRVSLEGDSCTGDEPYCNCAESNCTDDEKDENGHCEIECKFGKGAHYFDEQTEDVSYSSPLEATSDGDATEEMVNAAKASMKSDCDKLGGSLGKIKINKHHSVSYKLCQCDKTLFRIENVREARYSTLGADGSTKIPVYCINPGDDAPEGIAGDKKYPGAEIFPIDATACDNSYNTPDCGFSNILIEGYYRGVLKGNIHYNYAVIGTAMRLWSAHIGSSGFDGVGIADEDDNTIGNKNWLAFVPGNVLAFKESLIKYNEGLKIFRNVNKNGWVNVFKATLYYFENMNKYRLESISSIRDIDTTYDESNGKDGVQKIKDIACSNGLVGVYCNHDLEMGDYIYALALYANTLQGNDYMQEHLDEINRENNPTTFDSSNNYPEGFTTRVISDSRIEITYRLEEEVVIDCNTLDEDTANDIGCQIEQTITIKDSAGNEVGTVDIDSYDYCQKNYCYVEVEYNLQGEKICDKVTDVTITTDVTPNCGANSVKKYSACGSATGYQVMYSFEPDTCGTSTKEEITSTLFCNPCTDEIKTTNNKCSLDNKDFDKPVINSVEEPSLNCILNKHNSTTTSMTTKQDYDYSELFQVNTDICRVYCSDKLTYNMSGRKNVASSFQLKYDINKDLNPSLSSTNNLISIIQVERECVSHIFYEDDIDSKKLEAAYGLSEEFIKDWEDNSGKEEYIDIHNGMIDDWKELYGLLVAKSSEENFRTEVLNKLVYDLYNCNFLNLNSLPSGVEKPVDSVNSMNLLNELYNQTFNDCEANPESCFNGYINYEGGTEYIHPENSLTRVGESVNNPGLSAKFYKHHTDYGLLYCNGNFCFDGEVDGKYEDDFDPRYWKNSVFSNEVFSKLYDDFNETKGLVDILNVPVPTNDYVKFSIKGSIEIINNVKYQVEPATGKVQTEKDDKKDIYHTLPDNTFPVSSNAYNLCEYTDPYDSSIKIKGICDVNHNYNFPKFFNYSANSIFKKATFNENFNREVEKLNSFNCNYKVNCISGDPDTCVGYIHRNIDLANPVPVEREGTNWDSTNSNDLEYSSYVNGVISEIKESSNDNLYATDEYLEYSFVLSPTAIDEIRTDNKMYGYYQLPINCSKTDDGRYANCQSEFLNKIRDDNSSFSIVVNKDDGVSKFTENKNRPGGGE